jgi:sugar O-acyltransferase (sialic acid O-acetyltransferase NeuD family)
MKDIVIVGAGGLGREVAFLINDLNQTHPEWNLLGFLERDSAKVGTAVGEYSVIGTDTFFDRCAASLHVAIAIGQPKRLREISGRLEANSRLQFPNLIHPSVIVHTKRVRFGRGNIVCAGAVLTTDVCIGSFNLLNLNCTVGHDVEIGDCNVINPGVNISGNVTIGDCCLLGTGAVVI